jgi:hypothetical protein
MLSVTQLVKNLRTNTLTKLDISNRGGGWLGAARNWIQWNFINGSDVTWGSNDPLKMQRSLTVAEIEDFAARIALATLEQYKANLVTDGERAALAAYMNKDNWASYVKQNEGNLVCFQPDRQHMHFMASYKHKHGWDVAKCIDGENNETTS